MSERERVKITMPIRFYNCRILNPDTSEITFGQVHTDGGVITYVGNDENAPKDVEFEREINLNGNVIMPSFKNAHTHSAMTFLRSYADDMPLHDWLFKQVFPMEAKLNAEYIYKFARLAYMEYIASGTTACFDMYFEPEAMAQLAEDVGLRTVMCGAVSGSEDDCGKELEKLELNFGRFYSRSEYVTYRLGFHAEYTTDISIMRGVAALSHKYKQPVFMHNSETASEAEECIGRYGKTPTELFEELGIYDFGGGGFHCVYMSDSDFEIFRRRGLWAVTNPCSNAKLASGVAPLTKMCGTGIKLAVGTDGAASNNGLDMFREMYLATVLQKLADKDAAAMPAENILRAATCGGAYAMGLDDCDIIAVGKKADLIVIDLNQPNMQPINNIAKNLVFSGSGRNVALTMCNGKILYENGKFTTIDAERAYYEANEAVTRIKS